MKCDGRGGLFGPEEFSIEIYVYEDKIQKNYLLQIKGASINFVFEGDNYAADEMIILSQN